MDKVPYLFIYRNYKEDVKNPPQVHIYADTICEADVKYFKQTGVDPRKAGYVGCEIKFKESD